MKIMKENSFVMSVHILATGTVTHPGISVNILATKSVNILGTDTVTHSGTSVNTPYILEYNLHPFYSFRGLKKSDAD
jgi:hypothetical protein